MTIEETVIEFYYWSDSNDDYEPEHIGSIVSEVVPSVGSFVSLSSVRDEKGNYPQSPTAEPKLLLQGNVRKVEYSYIETGCSSQTNVQKCYVSVYVSDSDEMP
jgi:hypothetical protein